jgi:hypothetical protein
MWYLDDLDSDKMKVDYKYNINDDEKNNDAYTKRRKNTEEDDNKDYGKRDKPSPSNK